MTDTLPPLPTLAQALEALDDMDDYARMTLGVDAFGPREVLRRFIESAALPAAQPEPVAEVLSWTSGSYWRNYKLKWLRDVPEGTLLYAAPVAAPAAGVLASDAMDAHQANGLAWAVSRWQAEVSQRPLVNVHRRTLDDTWRQVVRYFGGDPDKLLGPSHDALASGVLASDERKQAEQAYTVSAFDYPSNPVGSRDWTLFWQGWQARAHGVAPCADTLAGCAPECGPHNRCTPSRTDLEWLRLPDILAKFADYAERPVDENALRIIRAVTERNAGVKAWPPAGQWEHDCILSTGKVLLHVGEKCTSCGAEQTPAGVKEDRK
jgi:hypothetical protein